MNDIKWSKNVIVADADYIDKVAFDLTVNFERMIGRPIPPADLARWLECIALDGGMRPGKEQETQVVFVHSKQKTRLENFLPASLADEISGKAFAGELGEFALSAYPVEELTTAEDYFTDVLRLVCRQKEVRRVMVVPDAEHIYNKVKAALQEADDDSLNADDPAGAKRITVFTMQPMAGGQFRQEILGYSLMAALGISADEIKER